MLSLENLLYSSRHGAVAWTEASSAILEVLGCITCLAATTGKGHGLLQVTSCPSAVCGHPRYPKATLSAYIWAAELTLQYQILSDQNSAPA